MERTTIMIPNYEPEKNTHGRWANDPMIRFMTRVSEGTFKDYQNKHGKRTEFIADPIQQSCSNVMVDEKAIQVPVDSFYAYCTIRHGVVASVKVYGNSLDELMKCDLINQLGRAKEIEAIGIRSDMVELVQNAIMLKNNVIETITDRSKAEWSQLLEEQSRKRIHLLGYSSNDVSSLDPSDIEVLPEISELTIMIPFIPIQCKDCIDFYAETIAFEQDIYEKIAEIQINEIDIVED